LTDPHRGPTFRSEEANVEPFELVAMREAARTVARWREMWGPNARQMVIEHLSGLHGDTDPAYRAAYLTAFGR